MGLYLLRSILVSVLLAGFAASASAVTFRADIDDSRWDLEASRFNCTLSQAVPKFGKAVFFREAGEKVVFSLEPTQKDAVVGVATLVAEASPWQPGMQPEMIGSIQADAGSGALKVASSQARHMLTALYRGMMPTFTSNSWYGTREPVRVGISSANFQSAYDDYMGCVSNLLPVNYRQIARTAVLFPSAHFVLSDATRARLDLIVEYVKTDTTVNKVYVDGHSDSLGRRLLNRDLSKRRAETVSGYLNRQGIDEEMIVTRYHGERYPVVKNNSKANRARNRRVTIRLERE